MSHLAISSIRVWGARRFWAAMLKSDPSLVLVHCLVFQEVLLSVVALLPHGLLWDYVACGVAYLTTLLFSKIMEIALPEPLHTERCQLYTCVSVLIVLAANMNCTFAVDVACTIGFAMPRKYLWWPMRAASAGAAGVARAEPFRVVTFALLRAAATASAARHREYVKKDTGYRCYVNLQCERHPRLGRACVSCFAQFRFFCLFRLARVGACWRILLVAHVCPHT